jgi:hypothetical protein
MDSLTIFNNKKHKNINYRNVSLSETDLDDLKKIPLIVDLQDNTKVNKETQTESYIESYIEPYKKIKVDLTTTIINKLILFFTHLFLISIFELIFFFNFVTKFEDKALIDVFNQMTNQATSICSSLDQNNKQIIDNFLGLFINTTQINDQSIISYSTRRNYNHLLLIQSIYYFIFVCGINLTLILLNCIWFQRLINYKTIILDNLVMITFLGIFEYIFFSTIVFKYQTISPNELNKQISDSILNNC